MSFSDRQKGKCGYIRNRDQVKRWDQSCPVYLKKLTIKASGITSLPVLLLTKPDLAAFWFGRGH